MNILITGSSGLVGSAITTYLFNKGHSLTCLKRNSSDDSTKLWRTDTIEENSFDAVIHLAGENIATGRWNKAKKERIHSSRVDGSKELARYISSLPAPPKTIISASAVGYYGNRGSDVVTETSAKGSGFLSDVCKDWEDEIAPLAQGGSRVVFTRFGMVCSPNGGALSKMIPPFSYGLGGKVGSGKQYVSWISIRDLVKMIDFILEHDDISGPVNMVSPNAVTNLELTKALGSVLGKATPFPLPAFVAKLLLGGEMTEELLLASTRARPGKMLKAGYVFEDEDLHKTLLYCAGKE